MTRGKIRDAATSSARQRGKIRDAETSAARQRGKIDYSFGVDELKPIEEAKDSSRFSPTVIKEAKVVAKKEKKRGCFENYMNFFAMAEFINRKFLKIIYN